MLIYVKKDLFQTPAQVIVNTVNTVGVMGKGIAKTFKEIYPEMFVEYQALCEKKLLTVGKLWIYKTPNKWVLNFPTKKHWRSPSKIEYIEDGLKKFVESYKEKGINSIAFPPLGCGNGGLNWEKEVRPLMEKYLKDLPIDIYIHLPPSEIRANKKEHLNIKEIKKWLWSEPANLSFFEVWEDILFRVEASSRIQANETSYEITVINEGDVKLRFTTNGKIDEITKDQLNDAWDVLRGIGVLSPKTVPDHLSGVSSLIFNLFNRLPYIEPIEIARSSVNYDENFDVGIWLVPVVQDTNYQGDLLI